MVHVASRRRIAPILFASVTAPLAAQTPAFVLDEVHRVLPAVHSAVRATAAADLDGDGVRDLVVMSGAYTSVWLDAGNGRFALRQDEVLIPGTFANKNVIAVGDFDGDGDRDLAALGVAYCASGGPTCSQGQGHLLWNDGTGRFVANAATLPIGADVKATSMAAGDIDGDGDVDLVVGCEPQSWAVWIPPQTYQTFSVRGEDWVFRNNGSGQFTASQLNPEQDATRAIVLADFDGDGDLDLFAANTGQDAYHQNNGAGVFTRVPTALPSETRNAVSAQTIDLEGDGDLDLLVLDDQGPRLLANNGSGVFTDVSTNLPSVLTTVDQLLVADFDGDGAIDVGEVGAGQMVQLRNNGVGVFTHVPAADRSVAGSPIVPLDLDRDTDTDVIGFGGAYREHQLLRNDGAGSLTTVPRDLPDALDNQLVPALADIDHDGDLDVLAPAETSPNRVYRNDGAGVFSSISFGDFTVDVGLTEDIAAGDLDGDGWTDAVLANYSALPSHVYRNDTNGQLVRVPLPMGFAASVALGDLDGDGDLDIYLGKPQSGGPATDQVWRNNGNMVFVPISSAVTGTEPTNSVVLADFDGDGDLDAALSAWYGGGNRVLLNNGSGVFTAGAPLPGPHGNSQLIVAVDVDGDGDQDLLIANDGEPNRLYRNNGNATFVDSSVDLPPNHRTIGFAAGDFDDDGDFDLVETAFSGSVPSRLLENDGLGHFTVVPGGLPPMTDMAHRVALADFDQDFDLDAFLVTQGAPHLFQNLRRQIAWRESPRIGRLLTMNVHGLANDPFAMVASPNRIAVPLPGLGLLQVDIGTPLLIEFGALDAQGRDSRTYFVPPWTSLLGVSIYWQALHVTPTRLGNLETTTLFTN